MMAAAPSILPTFPKDLGTPMQIIVLMTLLTLLPAIIMSITPFLRISIVLHFLRQALGTQTTPSNQVLAGLALAGSALRSMPAIVVDAAVTEMKSLPLTSATPLAPKPPAGGVSFGSLSQTCAL